MADPQGKKIILFYNLLHKTRLFLYSTMLSKPGFLRIKPHASGCVLLSFVFGFAFTLPFVSFTEATAAPTRTLIKNARLYIGDGTERKGDLAFNARGRITTTASAPAAGLDVIDAAGKILTPGFIDIGTGLGLVDIAYLSATREDSAGGDSIRAAFRVSDVFDPASPVIPVARRGGITSALATPSGGLVSGQSVWIDLTSAASGRHASIVRDTAALHVSLARGYKSNSRGGRFLKLRRLFDDLELFKQGKLTVQLGREHPADRLDFQALMRIQKERRPVFFRVDRAAHIESTLRFARARSLRPVIVGGAEAWRAAGELARTKDPRRAQPGGQPPGEFRFKTGPVGRGECST